MSLSPQNPSRFMHLVGAVMDRRKPAPTPSDILDSQLKASLLLEEKKSQLETMHLIEIAHREQLVRLYGNLAYHAEMFKFRFETREWDRVPSEWALALSRATREIVEADAKHNDMIDDIADLAGTIAQIEVDAQ